VRRLVGYARLQQDSLPPLNSVHTLAEDYVNFLQPVVKARREDPKRSPSAAAV
jgi:hypothetical protein